MTTRTLFFCRACGSLCDPSAKSCENCGDFIHSPPPEGCGPLIEGTFSEKDADALEGTGL